MAVLITLGIVCLALAVAFVVGAYRTTSYYASASDEERRRIDQGWLDSGWH